MGIHSLVNKRKTLTGMWSQVSCTSDRDLFSYASAHLRQRP